MMRMEMHSKQAGWVEERSPAFGERNAGFRSTTHPTKLPANLP